MTIKIVACFASYNHSTQRVDFTPVEEYEVSDTAKVGDLALLRNCPNGKWADRVATPKVWERVKKVENQEVVPWSAFIFWHYEEALEFGFDEKPVPWVQSPDIAAKYREVVAKAERLKLAAEEVEAQLPKPAAEEVTFDDARQAYEKAAAQLPKPAAEEVTFDDARQAYEKAATAGGSPFMSSRIMFIGAGRVGKSSTMKSLLGEDFKSDEPSTCGVQLGDCTLDCANLLDWKADKAHKDYTSQGIASMLTTVTQEKKPGTLPIASKEDKKVEAGEADKIADAGKGTGSGDQEGADLQVQLATDTQKQQRHGEALAGSVGAALRRRARVAKAAVESKVAEEEMLEAAVESNVAEEEMLEVIKKMGTLELTSLKHAGKSL